MNTKRVFGVGFFKNKILIKVHTLKMNQGDNPNYIINKAVIHNGGGNNFFIVFY
jgi:hypothetical protein